MYTLEQQRTLPRTGKIPSRGKSAAPQKFLTQRNSFCALLVPPQRSGKRHRDRTNMTAKILNWCSNDKLCLLTIPPIDQEIADKE